MRFTSLAIAAIALISFSASATKATSTPSLIQYTVTCQKTYVVKNGDTCSKIGKAFNIYTSYIKKWNPSINAGCTNLYIDQVLCLSAPTTQSSAIAVGTNSLVAPTPAPTKTAKTIAKATTLLTMPNAHPQCTKDADCAGARCCNLRTQECVLDPDNTLCGKQPTSTLSSTTATATSIAVPSGLTVQLSSSKDFCLFLPPSPGNKAAHGNKVDIDAIANSEKNAVAFCTKPNANAPAAAAMPSGFIKSASYQTNTASGFVQIRGSLNIAAYELSSKDQGGQYDNHGAGSPPNSVCSGYPYYVSLIEPNTATFCIRCCETYSDCNAGRSAYGCDRVVPAL